MKETIQTAAESFLPALWAMSRAMYDHPELGLEEVNSSRMLREWLAEQGFKVEENFHGLPTAFRAVYGSGRPVLGFLCEYDALPEVGHGCGHDLIGVVSPGAAANTMSTPSMASSSRSSVKKRLGLRIHFWLLTSLSGPMPMETTSSGVSPTPNCRALRRAKTSLTS